jgi:hypothetical protein
VTPAPADAAREASAGCSPQQLFPVFTSIDSSLSLAEGDSIYSQVAVVNDCGELVDHAAVAGLFSNGDRAVPFTALGRGVWRTTWQAQNTQSSRVSMDVAAVDSTGALQGISNAPVLLRSDLDAPVVFRDGMRAADAGASNPLAAKPGGLVRIRGARLADATEAAGVTVMLGTTPLPLISVSANEILARVPEDVAPGRTYDLYIKREGRISLPQRVAVGYK